MSRARGAMPDRPRQQPQQADRPSMRVDAALTALAEPTRRAVVELLRDGPRRAGELAEALQMSPPALSRHLRVLKVSGLLVDDEPAHDARVRLYRLQPEAFDALALWVDQVRSLWTDQLRAFQAHVAQRMRPGAPAPAPAAARAVAPVAAPPAASPPMASPSAEAARPRRSAPTPVAPPTRRRARR